MESSVLELASGGLSARRVLFVEDDATMRGLMSAFARMLGAETAEAGSANEALRYFAEHSDPDEAPHLLVVDIDLPGMDGISLCEKLSQTSRFPAHRVIVVSGTESAGDLRRVKALGARRFLRKPFLLEDFQAALCLPL
jgi:CheY-like chemotaxis protein